MLSFDMSLVMDDVNLVEHPVGCDVGVGVVFEDTSSQQLFPCTVICHWGLALAIFLHLFGCCITF